MDRPMIGTWLDQVQGSAMDDRSLDQYAAMVEKINRQILDAAAHRLRFEDEPAHFNRLLAQTPE